MKIYLTMILRGYALSIFFKNLVKTRRSSRPWNKFSINTRSEVDGSKILDYQGNWREFFQNWEALAYSYPQFIEGMIHKFLNSTTFDGYNPYRVTKDGFDWKQLNLIILGHILVIGVITK